MVCNHWLHRRSLAFDLVQLACRSWTRFTLSGSLLDSSRTRSTLRHSGSYYGNDTSDDSDSHRVLVSLSAIAYLSSLATISDTPSPLSAWPAALRRNLH